MGGLTVGDGGMDVSVGLGCGMGVKVGGMGVPDGATNVAVGGTGVGNAVAETQALSRTVKISRLGRNGLLNISECSFVGNNEVISTATHIFNGKGGRFVRTYMLSKGCSPDPMTAKAK